MVIKLFIIYFICYFIITTIDKLAADFEATQRAIEEQNKINMENLNAISEKINTSINTTFTPVEEIPQKDPPKPYSNPIFDIPGELLDKMLFAPYHKAHSEVKNNTI
jgi:translation elongation factor EF-4